MRTQIALADGRRLVTHPRACGGAVITIQHRATPDAPFTVEHEFALDLNEGGAFSFGLDTALEASQIARDRCAQCCADPRPDCMGAMVPGIGDNCAALKCAGDGLCSVPSACPTPIACGVAA